MINVSIVEAHSVQRIGLKALIEDDPSISVTRAWSSLQQVDFDSTDVLVLSYCSICTPPHMELVESIATDYHVVLFSGKETPISLLAYSETGAQALLHQSVPEEEVLRSIRVAAAGGSGVKHQPIKPPSGLSQRESLVLGLVGDGYTNDQIARRIGISKHTVDTYLRRVRRKLNLGNKAQLARAAMHLAGPQAKHVEH